MRKTILQQLGLVPPCRVDHPHAHELARMSETLDELPQTAELVAGDLTRGTTGSKAGRDGMTGEQVLRAALLMLRCTPSDTVGCSGSESDLERVWSRGRAMLEGEDELVALAYEVCGGVAPSVQVGASAQCLSELCVSALAHVVDDSDGDGVLSLQSA